MLASYLDRGLVLWVSSSRAATSHGLGMRGPYVVQVDQLIPAPAPIAFP